MNWQMLNSHIIQMESSSFLSIWGLGTTEKSCSATSSYSTKKLWSHLSVVWRQDHEATCFSLFTKSHRKDASRWLEMSNAGSFLSVPVFFISVFRHIHFNRFKLVTWAHKIPNFKMQNGEGHEERIYPCLPLHIFGFCCCCEFVSLHYSNVERITGLLNIKV